MGVASAAKVENPMQTVDNWVDKTLLSWGSIVIQYTILSLTEAYRILIVGSRTIGTFSKILYYYYFLFMYLYFAYLCGSSLRLQYYNDLSVRALYQLRAKYYTPWNPWKVLHDMYVLLDKHFKR